MSLAAPPVKQNEPHVQSLEDKAKLGEAPSLKTIIITCMDARIHLESIFDIKPGTTHVLRNAGGRASEALRSVIVSQRCLGTEEIIVLHHTHCGMATFTDDYIRTLLKNPPTPRSLHATVDSMAFLPFTDLEQTLEDDVEFLRGNPLVQHPDKITGWMYDVDTGKANQLH